MPRRVSEGPFGGRGSDSHPRQNYSDIISECRSKNSLFKDPCFPATYASLFYKNRPAFEIEWKRPKEICKSHIPAWMVEDFSRFDVKQGCLGDCWLIAAIASLTCNKRLFEKVVPPDQSFEYGYCGVFRFRLWFQGEWVDVVVDDRLPTDGSQLVYMHSDTNREFWSALLEKAYAKLYGSYESLKGGTAVESLEDLTGGLAETIGFTADIEHDYLKEVMMKTMERGGLLTCSMNPQSPSSPIDPRKSVEGLLYNHVYSVTKVEEVTLLDGSNEFLVRVRNPWGNDKEWRGAWADRASNWNLVSPELKRQISLKDDEDGEFWMSFADFTSHFNEMNVCNLDPLYIEDATVINHMTWDVVSYHNGWYKYVNAGGCGNHDTMWKNPQFRVTLSNPDVEGGDQCSMIVALMQKDGRQRLREDQEMFSIGYSIYKVTTQYQNKHLDEDYFRYNSSEAKSKAFLKGREVCGRHRLQPGDYVIIPSTFEPEQEANFLLRIFTEKQKTSSEIDEETSYRIDTVESLDVVDGQNEDLEQLISLMGEGGEEIDAYKLMDILNSNLTALVSEFSLSGFPLDACRSMVAMHGHARRGRLNHDEYTSLCRDLVNWKEAFLQTDSENTGQISSYRLRSTLHSLGYHVSNNTLQAMVTRYVNRDGNIDFPDFLLAVVRLKTLIANFQTSEPADIDDFVQASLYS